MESIAISVCANWIYEFLKLALPISPNGVIAYFANNQITLTELQAKQLTDVIEHDNLELKAEQLNEESFAKELENNENFQQFIEDINQTIINNNNRVQITGKGDFLKDSSRKIEAAGNYTEDNRVTNNYAATNNQKKH